MARIVTIDASPQDMSCLAAQFALLADPLRLRILESLAREQLCPSHLIEITGARQTTISNQLRVLREAGAVLAEHEGRFTWYRLAPGAFAEGIVGLQRIVACGEPARPGTACAS